MFSPDGPDRFAEKLKDFHEQCRQVRDLIHNISVDPPGDLSVYLDAALALVEVTFQGAELTSEAVDDVRSGQLTRQAFIQRLFRLNLTLQLPRADDLTMPARLVKLLNENRFLTLSDRAPLEQELNESALWELLQLNERLHDAWEHILETFAWPRWADRVSVELRPSEPPNLLEAFEIYFQLPTDSKPGRSFANKWRDSLCWWPAVNGLPDDNMNRLFELRQEIQAVRRILAVPIAAPLPDTNGTARETTGELPAMLSAPDLARTLEQPVSRVESFLRRFREDHPDSFTEVDNPRKNEPRYLYRTADVWPALQQQLPNWRKRTDG
jgi:hypothetical protein